MDYYIIDEKCYVKELCLGKGSYGVVERVVLQDSNDDNGQKIAIKKLKDKHFPINIVEIYLSTKFIHPFINKTVYKEHINEIFLFQEEAVSDLYNWMKKNFITHSLMETWTAQILDGLNFLHSNDIVHGDIKPSNILIFRDGKIKLTDFSFTRLITGEKNYGQFYTLPYKPLEVLKYNYCTKRSDMWALGCTIYKMIYRRDLFVRGELNSENVLLSINEWKKFKSVDKNGIELEQFSKINLTDDYLQDYIFIDHDYNSDKLKIFNIMMDMLTVNEVDRVTCLDILCLEPFKKYTVSRGNINWYIYERNIWYKKTVKRYKSIFYKNLCKKRDVSYKYFVIFIIHICCWLKDIKQNTKYKALYNQLIDEKIGFSLWLTKCFTKIQLSVPNDVYIYYTKEFFKYLDTRSININIL